MSIIKIYLKEKKRNLKHHELVKINGYYQWMPKYRRVRKRRRSEAIENDEKMKNQKQRQRSQAFTKYFNYKVIPNKEVCFNLILKISFFSCVFVFMHRNP